MRKWSSRIAASALALSGALVLGTVQSATAHDTTTRLSLHAVKRGQSVVLKGRLFSGHPRVDGNARIQIVEPGEGIVGRTRTSPVGGYSCAPRHRGVYIADFKGVRYVSGMRTRIRGPSRSTRQHRPDR